MILGDTNKVTVRGRALIMHYNEDALMDTFDKWNDRDKRDRFRKRMEHKLHAKEQGSRNNPY